MKISNSTSNIINQAYGNNAAHQNTTNANAKSEKGKEANSSANVDLSNRTKDIQKISQALDVEPVAISEKVSQLKKEVDENRYNVDANKVAGKILGSLLDEII